MDSEILINVLPNQVRVAYLEGGSLSELKVEKKHSPTIVGSIYKGRVAKVLPGMQAAFVDIGLSRAGFLYVGEVRSQTKKYDDHFLDNDDTEIAVEDTEAIEEIETKDDHPPIQDLLKEGQEILVQVAKDPLGTKGPRLTTHVSLPGRYAVYMPTVDHLGVSRKITDDSKRRKLLKMVKSFKVNGGLIVRTAGEDAETHQLKADFDYLKLLWKEIDQSYKKRKSIGLIHNEVPTEMRALRDWLSDEVTRVIIDDSKVHKKAVQFVSQFMPQFKSKIKLYKGNTPLFDEYDVDLEVSRALSRKVWLKSGGYIVIDEAEALVVIDVNTGSYVGKKDIDETILKTNLEAAQEVAHQLKVRNTGGIIVIDFIDMEKLAHREKVMMALNEHLSSDRSRTEVMSMSELGLVEMTRKRTRPSLVSVLCEPCSYCDGNGYIKRSETVANEIFRELKRESSEKNHKNWVVSCHSKVADWIYSEETAAIEATEKVLQATITIDVRPGFHREQYEIKPKKLT